MSLPHLTFDDAEEENATLTPSPTRRPFLAALRSLRKLKKIDIASGVDPEKPLLLTTARVVELMRDSWLELDELAVAGLRGAQDGPMWEDEDMWDRDAEEDEEEHEEIVVTDELKLALARALPSLTEEQRCLATDLTGYKEDSEDVQVLSSSFPGLHRGGR